MKSVLVNFFNDFLTVCRRENIKDIDLYNPDIEYVGDNVLHFTGRLEVYPFLHLLEDILHEGAEVIDVEWTFTGIIARNYIFKVKLKNGARLTETVTCMPVPGSGRARFTIEFSPFLMPHRA